MAGVSWGYKSGSDLVTKSPLILHIGVKIPLAENGNFQELLIKSYRKLVLNQSKTYGTSLYNNQDLHFTESNDSTISGISDIITPTCSRPPGRSRGGVISLPRI
eukprot:sb/3478144/